MAEGLTDSRVGHYYPPNEEVDLAWSPQGSAVESEPAVPHYEPPAGEADLAWSPCSSIPAQRVAIGGVSELTSRRFNRHSNTDRVSGTTNPMRGEYPESD